MDDWLRAGADYVLLIDPYAEEFYVYDGRTCTEGRLENPRSLCGMETLAPRPDLFPGLLISIDDILAIVRATQKDLGMDDKSDSARYYSGRQLNNGLDFCLIGPPAVSVSNPARTCRSGL